MRKFLFVFSAAVLLLCACSKEPSFELPTGTQGGSGGGNTSSGLLARSVLAGIGGGDSIVNTYAYDAARRLMVVTLLSTGYVDQIRFERDAIGTITRSITKNPDLAILGLDSLVTRYRYNTSTSRYTAALFEFPVQGLTYTDSTAFNYNNTGFLTSKIAYAVAAGIARPYSRLDYTYSTGNLSSVKSYSYPNNTWELDYTFNFTYDAKLNPLKLGVEALLVDPYASNAFGMNAAIYFGGNNATVIDYKDGSDPADNFKVTSAFTYDNADKPTGGTATETPSNEKYQWRFYYY